MMEGDAKGRVFYFSVPTHNITKDLTGIIRSSNFWE